MKCPYASVVRPMKELVRFQKVFLDPGNVMYMADWVKRLDAFLQFNEEDILHDKGKVTAAIAKAFAEKEFEKFRVLQDRTYQSDFDRLVAETSDDLTE